MNEPTGTIHEPAAAAQAAGGVSAATLRDRLGRTYTELVAAGKRILPKLHPVTKLFMPKGGRKPGSKTKPKMETATATTPADQQPGEARPASSTAENGAVGSQQPDAPAPSFSDVEAAARTAPKDETAGARAEALTEELAAVSENTTAETIIGIVQTGLILIGDEEGILSEVEKDLLRKPLTRVLAKYNVGKDALPPEADLALAVLALFVARLKKPKTATAWVKFKAWGIHQWASFQGKRIAAKVEAGA